MDVVRLNVQHSSLTIKGYATGLFGRNADRLRLVKQSQLAFGFDPVGG